MHGLLYCWTLQRSQDNHKYAWAEPVACMDFFTAGPSRGHKTIINMPGLGLQYAWACAASDKAMGGGVWGGRQPPQTVANIYDRR